MAGADVTGPDVTGADAVEAGAAAGSGTGAQWRVDFDAEVVFANGGALQTQGFRLDIPGDSIGDGELGELLVRHLGLLMAGATKVTRKELIREPHKGSRHTGAGPARRRTADLTGPATRAAWPPAADRPGAAPALAGLVDLPVALVRLTGAAVPVADRLALAPFRLAGHAVVIETGRPDGPYLTEDAVALLAGEGAALVATDATRCTGAVAEALAAAGLPLVTGLSALAGLPAEGVRLHVVPAPAEAGSEAGDTGWTRVYGMMSGAA